MPENVLMDANITTVLVAAVSGTGGGLIIRELVAGLLKMARGVSGKVAARQDQVAIERDRAIKRADDAEADRDAAERARDGAEKRVDVERNNRRLVDGYAWQLERLLAQNGVPNTIAQPVIADTMTPAQVAEIKGGTTP